MAGVLGSDPSPNENTNPDEGSYTGPTASVEDREKKSFAPSVDHGLSSDIAALKKKILELEAQQTRTNSADAEKSSMDPNAIAEAGEFRRMEACLYKHRKEWELEGGPGNWHPFWNNNDPTYRELKFGGHEWDILPLSLESRLGRVYERPDIFDPTHNCGADSKSKDTQEFNGRKDDYDTTIDWGIRRDRLRKCFEWEMERMFLSEELQRKREERVKNAELKTRRKRRMAEAIPQNSGDQKVAAEATILSASAEPKLEWLDWHSFKSLGHVEGKDVSVIEVLVGEPIIDDDAALNRFWFGSSKRGLKKNVIQSTDKRSLSSPDPVKSPLPERIRIHSDALLRILADILGSDGNTLLELEDMTGVFMRPYKALIYREDILRKWCQALEKKFKRTSFSKQSASNANESMVSAEGQGNLASDKSSADEETTFRSGTDRSNVVRAQDVVTIGQTASKQQLEEKTASEALELDDENDIDEGEGNSDDLTRSLTALEHLRCLLQFLDSTVAAKRSYLQSPECRKIFFSDLWLLFRPGTLVTSNDGKQAYKVIGVTSAKHRVVPYWERWRRANDATAGPKKPDFSLSCVYIDFDGEDIGPVWKPFEFERYDGQREITSLPVYPLRFYPLRRSDYSDTEWENLQSMPVQERYRQMLIHRGKKFLHVAKGKHMYYAGSTLEAKDEVESPVVIDFETTFFMHDVSPPNADSSNTTKDVWKPRLTTLLGIQNADNEHKDASCNGECCREEFVYNDQYVDRRQITEYIDGLLPKANALHEQPPITIMPRPLKDLQTGPEGSHACQDDELVILPYRVFGFVLRSRKFAKLDLAYLSDIHSPKETTVKTTMQRPDNSRGVETKTERRSAFDRLVLEEGHHSMIVSLIAQHFRDKKSTTGEREEFDIVKGKGKGLIILLHGAPGVGKTSTAEGVAELFEKPLLQITCGDLGTTATEVEQALEKNFSLANKWDCILLLDEADVFLAERTKEDFQRNGLVAVFLRLMEYYPGILFLTTNRVGDFDEAFTSRIHVSLYYPELNEHKTRRVFEINMDMIEERFATKGRAIKIDRIQIDHFAKTYFSEHPHARWNGRQIRNACQTALALAEFEAQDRSLKDTEDPNITVNLTVEHFKIVRDAYLEFTKYMHDLYGTTAARKAKEAKLRAIWFDENDRVVRTQNMEGTALERRKNAFLLASQDRPNRPPGHSPQQSYQQPSFQQTRYPQPTYQQHGNYPPQGSAFGAPQPQQPVNSYHTQPLYPSQHNWDSSPSRYPDAFTSEMQNEGQYPMSPPPRQQPSPTPHPQHQAQSMLNENIRNMYAASGKQTDQQATAGASAPTAPGWSCAGCGLQTDVRPSFCSDCGTKA